MDSPDTVDSSMNYRPMNSATCHLELINPEVDCIHNSSARWLQEQYCTCSYRTFKNLIPECLSIQKLKKKKDRIIYDELCVYLWGLCFLFWYNKKLRKSSHFLNSSKVQDGIWQKYTASLEVLHFRWNHYIKLFKTSHCVMLLNYGLLRISKMHFYCFFFHC